MKEESCSCGGNNIQPIFFKNSETKKIEIDVLVCQDCLREFCVSPITREAYLQSRRESL
jgi:hypothetical protein